MPRERESVKSRPELLKARDRGEYLRIAVSCKLSPVVGRRFDAGFDV